VCERIGFPDRRAELWPLGIRLEARTLDVCFQIFVEIVICGHVVALAALFVQPDPSAPPLDEVVLDFHGDRGADAGEGEHHEADESAIAQAHHARQLFFLAALELYRSRSRNTIEQRARLLSCQHRRLALSDRMFRSAHGVGGIHVDDVTDYQPVKQHPQRGQVLLDGRLGKLLQELLDEGGDVDRPNSRKIVYPVVFTPFREPARRIIVCAPGVSVANVSGEELPEALRGLRFGQEQHRQPGGDGVSSRGPSKGIILAVLGSSIVNDNVLYHSL
jgi:hypothetical protein